jgi:hypothetical protein
MNGFKLAAFAVLGCAFFGGTQRLACAQDEHGRATEPGARTTLEFDPRYHLDHYYPKRGLVTTVLPAGSVAVDFDSGNLFFHAGVWFRPDGARFVVITPPLGVVVPMLPPDCVTIWSGGVPYYYADGVFYAAAADKGYTVTAPPQDAARAVPLTSASPAFQALSGATRRQAKTAEQTKADRSDCTTWGRAQPLASSDDTMFQVAFDACMEERGYAAHGS